MPTVVTTGNGAQLVSTFLAKHYGGVVGSDARDPMGTVTSVDHHSLVAAHMTKFYGTSTGSSMDEPVHTVTAGGQDTSSTGLKHGLVCAFLTKYYGSGGQLQGVDEPVHTATGKPRFGLVTVTIQGQPYVIADIGMRMLSPRELFRAQGFPDDYVIDLEMGGKPLSKSAQVKCCGNSVCPDVAAALVRANCLGLEESAPRTWGLMEAGR